MLVSEKAALQELYIQMAVNRAVEEIDAVFNLTEAGRERTHELETELKEQARSVYTRERELLATEDEFQLVWRTIREDILREVRALQAMA